MDYVAYRELVDQGYANGQTTGEDHSEAMLHYTHMNIARMKRLDKTTRLSEATLAAIQQIERKQIWLVITEGWCGDAAQIIPVLEKMGAETEMVDLRYILRDQHLDIIDAFLTNGGRSIPKILVLDAASLDVLNTWGPRPHEVQSLMVKTKKDLAALDNAEDKAALNETVKRNIQLMYAKDKTRSIQSEFLEIVG